MPRTSLALLLITITLLPHLNLADFHLASTLGLPCGIPSISRIPEVFLGHWCVVNPWFSTLAVLEPSVGATNSNVEDQIKLLVEWSLLSASLAPRVQDLGSVAIGVWESSPSPKIFIEVGIKHLKKIGVYVGEKVLLRPFQSKFVLRLSIGGVESLPLDVGSPPSIICGVGTPVKGGGDDVVTSLTVGVVITTALYNVDFTG